VQVRGGIGVHGEARSDIAVPSRYVEEVTSLRRRPAAVAAVLLVAPLALAACSDDAAPATETAAAAERSYGETATTTSTPGDGDAALMPAEGAEMLAGLSADLVGGGRLDLGDYADEPLLLWFWAPF
jgi:hypothetical protein